MSLRDWWPGLNWNFNRKYRKCRIIFIFASVQNWPGLGHKYFSLHRSEREESISWIYCSLDERGAKRNFWLAEYCDGGERCLTQQNNINIGTRSIILLSRHTKLCTDPWKTGKRVLMRRYADADVVWVWSRDDNHIVWCQMRCGQKPLLIQKYYMSIITDVFGLSLSSIFNLFVLAKFYNFKLYYLRFCETKLNLICYNKNKILPADTKLDKKQESRDGMGKPICKLHRVMVLV